MYSEIAIVAGGASTAQYKKHKNDTVGRYDHEWKEDDPVSATVAGYGFIISLHDFLIYQFFS